MIISTESFQDDETFSVQRRFGLIINFNLRIDHFLIRVTNQGNQKIKENDLDKNLIDPPSKVNRIYHYLGKSFSVTPWFTLFIILNILPDYKSWENWVSDCIIEVVKEISKE